MPVDLSKLSDEELEAYLAVKERKEIDRQGKSLTEGLSGPAGPRIPSDLQNGVTSDILGVRYQPKPGAMAPGQIDKNAFAKGMGNLLIGAGGAGLAANAAKVSSGLRGGLASSAIGAGESLASDALRAGTGENVSGTEAGIGAALGALLPGMGRAVDSQTAKNGYGKAREFIHSMLGAKVEPSAVSQLPSVTSSVNRTANTSPVGRVFAQTSNNVAKSTATQKEMVNTVVAEGQRLKEKEQQLKAQVVKLKNSIDSAKRTGKRGVGKMEMQLQDLEDSYTAPGIDEAIKLAFGESTPAATMHKFGEGISEALENKSNILAARQQVKAAKTGQLKIPDGPLDVDVPNARIEALEQNMARTKEAMIQSAVESQRFKAIDLPKLKSALEASPAVDPRLRPFTKAATPSEFHDVLKKTSHENVAVLRGQLSKAGQASLEKTFTHDFVKTAIGPDGTLTNIEAATKAYPLDKIAAIYGGSQAGWDKARSVQTVVDDARRMIEESSKKDIFDYMGKRAASATIGGTAYLLINKGIVHPGQAAAGAAITGAAIAIPKLIDAAVRSPKFGQQFHRWATEGGATMEALRDYPLVKTMIEEHSRDKKEE